MSDQKDTTQGVDNSQNQPPQGGADKAQGASSGSNNDIALNEALKMVETLKKETYDHRENKRLRDEQDKKKEQEEAVKRGEHEKLWKDSDAENAKLKLDISSRIKADENRTKKQEKQVKDALGRLPADQQKTFDDMYGDLNLSPEEMLSKLNRFNPSINNPTAANSIPSSTGNQDNMNAVMDKIKTDPNARKELNNPTDIKALLRNAIL